jgi:hypothetical protein
MQHNNPFRINDLETTNDGNVWLGTEYGLLFMIGLQTVYFNKEKFHGIKILGQLVVLSRGLLVHLFIGVLEWMDFFY